MGVKGLKTFLKNYKSKYQYSENSIVRSQLLLIDGNNLMCHLYFKPNKKLYGDHLFGGNLTAYAEEIHTFFDQLSSARIQPIVVFDGAIEKEKFYTILNRFYSWLKKSYKIDVNQLFSTNVQYSDWMSVVFHTVLEEMNVPQFQTEWEADDTIALIAKELGCLLLSDDTDFHIYQGIRVIGYESFKPSCQLSQNWRDSSTALQIVGFNARFINAAKIYKEEFGIVDIRLLALGVSLIGNDYVKPFAFSRFVSHLDGFVKGMSNAKKVKIIFTWIGKQKSFESALDEVIASARAEKQDKIKAIITYVMESYMGSNGEVKLLQRIKSKFGAIESPRDDDAKYTESDLAHDLHQKVVLDECEAGEMEDGDSDLDEEEQEHFDFEICAASIYLPPWFMELYTTCQLPHYLIQIAYNKVAILRPQFELETAPPSQELSVPIIQSTAGIILGSDSILLVTHEDKNNLKKIFVPTILHIPPDGRVLSLENMKILPVKLRSDYLLRSLCLSGPEIDFVYSHPTPLQLSLGCILFLVKGLKSPSSVAVGLAVMIASLEQFVASSQGMKPKDDGNWRSSRILTMTDILEQDCQQKGKNFRFYRKFLKAPDCKSDYVFRQGYDKQRTFDYTQYKCVLYHAAMLNKVLRSPFNLEQVPDCYLVYNVTTRLSETEYRFMDFIKDNFGPGFSQVLQDFLKFLCKTSGVHLNGYFSKKGPKKDGNKQQWRAPVNKTEGSNSTNRFSFFNQD